MKRKRFIKLLMSHGIQRNEANEHAKGANEIVSYQVLYGFIYVNEGRSLGFINRVVQAGQAVLQSFKEVYKTVYTAGVDFASGPDQTVECGVMRK